MLRLTVSVVLVAIFLYFYLDGNFPEPIPEKWKVKVMDATMKTYSYLDFLETNHTSTEFKQSIYYDYIDQEVWMPKRFVRDEILKEGMEQRTDVGSAELLTKINDKLLDPLMSPMLTYDELLENLPFTYIMVYDFVRDDGIMFYERLRQVGKNVQLAYYYEAFHNTLFFPHGPLKMEVAARIVAYIVKALKTNL